MDGLGFYYKSLENEEYRKELQDATGDLVPDPACSLIEKYTFGVAYIAWLIGKYQEKWRERA